MKSRIFLSPPCMSGNEQQYINEAFETEIGNYLNIKNVAALSSGTAAIHLALINAGVKDGDYVIVPSFTFSATINPVVYQRAIPVFIDSEKQTWNMDPQLLRESVKELIAKGKKPKAILLVHIYGMPALIDDIIGIANEFEIPLIEDAAESMGSKYKEKFTGAYGVMGILSFNGNKIITTSGGGALISDNEEFVKHARFLSTQAKDNFPFYHHTHIGYNYRLSNVSAGIGRGQLKVLDSRIAERREVFRFYQRQFENIQEVSFCMEKDSMFSNRWLSCILIDKNNEKFTDNQLLIKSFENENIETRYLWKPMHLQPVFKDYPAYVNGVSETLFDKGLCLPSGNNMKEEELMRIEKVIKKTFHKTDF